MKKPSEFIRFMNETDLIVRLWRIGEMAALEMLEALVERGWYDVDVQPGSRTIRATYNAVVYRLGTDG